jgi:hypothetical protein
MPGVTLKMKSNVYFLVYGYLKIDGRAGDSVYVTNAGSSFTGNSIIFSNPYKVSYLKGLRMTRIEGIKVTNSSLQLLNSTITNCYGFVEHGQAQGPIDVWGGNCVFRNCVIADNNIKEYPFGPQGSVGLCMYDANYKMENVLLSNNRSGTTVIYNDNVNASLKNVSVINNDGTGFFMLGNWSYDKASIVNSIFYGNSGDGISGKKITVSFSDCFNNGGMDYNISNSIAGSNVTINANGDSCDGFYNISMDPYVYAPKYRILSNSPCVDAGSNDSITFIVDLSDLPRIGDGHNDSTMIVDIGAYELNDQLDLVKENSNSSGIYVIPNPTSGDFMFSNNSSPEQVVAYNSKGSKVELVKSHNNYTLAHVPAGLYLIVAISDHKIKTFRVVKN